MHKALLELQGSHPRNLNRIVGNREGLQKLREAISRAEAAGEAHVENDNPQPYYVVLDDTSPRLGESRRKQPPRWLHIFSMVVGILIIAMAIIGGFAIHAWYIRQATSLP